MSASEETSDLWALVECRQIVGNVGTAFADMPTTPYKRGVVVGEPGFGDTVQLLLRARMTDVGLLLNPATPLPGAALHVQDPRCGARDCRGTSWNNLGAAGGHIPGWQ